MIFKIISDVEYSIQFEYFIKNSKLFNETFYLIFISKNKTLLERIAKKNKIKCYSFYYKKKKDFFFIFFKIIFLLKKFKPQAIHCHLRKAVILGLLAGWICRVEKRIFTRHHGDENDDIFFRGYLIDCISNFFATHIVSISKAVSRILIKMPFTEKKINLIYHGFNIGYYKKNFNKKKKFFKKYNIKKNYKVFGVISRFVDWKGIEFAILGFKKYLTHNKKSILILANAQGEYKHVISKFIRLLPKENFRIIKFEKDFSNLYSSFDCFIHVPTRLNAEAFGQVFIEAMLFKVPSVFTKSGISTEICRHLNNCFLVRHKNSNDIYKGINWAMDSNQKKILFLDKQTTYKFCIKNMIKNLNKLYEKK